MRALLLIGSTALSVLLVEITLRLLGLGFSHAPMVSDPVLHHAHPRNYSYRAYHPSGEYEGHLVHFDAQGYRVAPSAPGADGLRIAILGDSFVEALQVDAAASLTGRLQAAAHGAAVRNFGVSSYSPFLYVLQWQRDIAGFAPHLVIVVLFSNDIADDEMYARLARLGADGAAAAVPGPPDDPLRNALRRLHVARLAALGWNRLAWWWTHRDDARTAVNDSPFLEERVTITALSGAQLLKLRQAVTDAGARFIVTTVPSRAAVNARRPADDAFGNAVRDWAARNSVQYVDLVSAFVASANASPLYFANDIHWTPAGHAVAATTLCRAIGELSARCDMPQ